jgi:nitric-oxide synthase
VRYAGYRQPDGTVRGDPLHADLTEAVQALGWSGEGGEFDVLPVVIQMPGEAPRWFRRAYVNAAPRPNFRRQPTPLP